MPTSREVLTPPMPLGGFASRGTVAALTSCASGDGISAVVADRLLDFCELPESIEDRLGDLRCPGVTPASMLSFRLIGVDGFSTVDSNARGACNGLVPKICDTPFL